MTAFRDIQMTDIPAVLDMMQDFYAIDGYPIDIAHSQKLWEQFISDEKLGKSWLITFEGEPVGYLILTFIFSFEYAGRIAFLDELYIKEDFRGEGIGKKAIAFVKEAAADYELALLYLEVEPHNTAAQQLYLSSGFSKHKRSLLYIKP